MMKPLTVWTLCVLWKIITAGPVPLTVNGHLLSTESLDQQEHQVIFQRIGEYATDVEFHHVHIPVPPGSPDPNSRPGNGNHKQICTQHSPRKPDALSQGQLVSRR